VQSATSALQFAIEDVASVKNHFKNYVDFGKTLHWCHTRICEIFFNTVPSLTEMLTI